MKTTEVSKAAVYRKISIYLGQLGVRRDSTMIKNKLVHLEKGYKLALAFLKASGSVCNNPDPERPIEENMEDPTNKGIVLNYCPYWFRLRPVFTDRAAMEPAYTSDTLRKSVDPRDSEGEEGEMEASNSVTYNESVPPEVDFSLPDLPEDDFPAATTQHVTR
ncbi:hypothetical protein RvY_08982-2 [Ramazzottius varieornatus]|nr:hypothetical protein RvY_08982-2 [Ramazzottius varieornatus]